MKTIRQLTGIAAATVALAACDTQEQDEEVTSADPIITTPDTPADGMSTQTRDNASGTIETTPRTGITPSATDLRPETQGQVGSAEIEVPDAEITEPEEN